MRNEISAKFWPMYYRKRYLRTWYVGNTVASHVAVIRLAALASHRTDIACVLQKRNLNKV